MKKQEARKLPDNDSSDIQNCMTIIQMWYDPMQ